MQKLVLEGFEETKLSNRFIPSQEDINEFITIESCGFQVFIFGYKPGQVTETHTHNEIRLTFIRLGQMQFTLEDKSMRFGAGDLITILPNIPHSFRAIGEGPLHIVEFVVFTSSEDPHNNKTTIRNKGESE